MQDSTIGSLRFWWAGGLESPHSQVEWGQHCDSDSFTPGCNESTRVVFLEKREVGSRDSTRLDATRRVIFSAPAGMKRGTTVTTPNPG